MSDPGIRGSAKQTQSEPIADRPLTDAERSLVEQHIGLVHVHLRRHWYHRPRWFDRCTADDLFQVGCCGLINAARLYRADSGIAFPAFALPRIRTAINRSYARDDAWSGPNRQRSNPEDMDFPRIDRLHGDPIDSRSAASDAIADRIRTCYETAVDHALESVTTEAGRSAARGSPRLDRSSLIRRIVEHRLLVPEPSARESIRAVARLTGSSYSRVYYYDRKLVAAVRRHLETDPEFNTLAQPRRHLSDD